MQSWKINQAKAHLSELLQNTKKEPQLVENRNKKIGVVISYESYLELVEAKEKMSRPTLKTMINKLISIKEEMEDIDVMHIIEERKNRKSWVE